MVNYRYYLYESDICKFRYWNNNTEYTMI